LRSTDDPSSTSITESKLLLVPLAGMRGVLVREIQPDQSTAPPTSLDWNSHETTSPTPSEPTSSDDGGKPCDEVPDEYRAAWDEYAQQYDDDHQPDDQQEWHDYDPDC
jgi:hypothetical protein